MASFHQTHAGGAIPTTAPGGAIPATAAVDAIPAAWSGSTTEPTNPVPKTPTVTIETKTHVNRPPLQVFKFEGHSAEVDVCQWHPKADVLVSGSRDTTARIWNIFQKSTAATHTILKFNGHNSPVTGLNWNPLGNCLAVAYFDGTVQIWSTAGKCGRVLFGHKFPIRILKWSPNANFLLTCAFNGQSIVWEGSTGKCMQSAQLHRAAIKDADWQSNELFATCSVDKRIIVFKIGTFRPIICFNGHTGDVNGVRWDPQSQLLASCSNDRTIKIWSITKQKGILDLQGHYRKVMEVKWLPTGPGTNNTNVSLILASASNDIRLWDINRGACIRVLSKHIGCVHSIAFSPNGMYLASGGSDKHVYVWNVRSGQVVHSYMELSRIFQVCWNAGGSKVAACTEKSNVFVLLIQ